VSSYGRQEPDVPVPPESQRVIVPAHPRPEGPGTWEPGRPALPAARLGL